MCKKNKFGAADLVFGANLIKLGLFIMLDLDNIGNSIFCESLGGDPISLIMVYDHNFDLILQINDKHNTTEAEPFNIVDFIAN